MDKHLITLLASLVQALQLYFLLLLVRISLYWLPNVPLYQQPWSSLLKLTDPYLLLFRFGLPFFLGVDISPIFAFLAMQFLIEVLSFKLKNP